MSVNYGGDPLPDKDSRHIPTRRPKDSLCSRTCSPWKRIETTIGIQGTMPGEVENPHASGLHPLHDG